MPGVFGSLQGDAPWIHREGVLWHEPSQTDLLFVTLNKSEASSGRARAPPPPPPPPGKLSPSRFGVRCLFGTKATRGGEARWRFGRLWSGRYRRGGCRGWVGGLRGQISTSGRQALANRSLMTVTRRSLSPPPRSTTGNSVARAPGIQAVATVFRGIHRFRRARADAEPPGSGRCGTAWPHRSRLLDQACCNGSIAGRHLPEPSWRASDHGWPASATRSPRSGQKTGKGADPCRR